MTTKNNPFKGVGVALATPFTSDGSVDFDALGDLVRTQLAGGVDFICVLGTTAETPCLTADEKQRIKDFVVNEVAGRIPLLLGCGTNSTAAVTEFLSQGDLSGIDGVLIVCPYYNKPTQEGLYRHFKAVAAATELPVVLYNVPGRPGVNLEADTTLRLARECTNIVAVKEASSRIEQIRAIIDAAPAGFDVLSGDDALTFDLMRYGAVGVISVVANAYPAEFSTMVHAMQTGNEAGAESANRRLTAIYPLLSADGNPAGLKSLLAVLGKAENRLRLPLVPARETTYQAIEAFVKECTPGT